MAPGEKTGGRYECIADNDYFLGVQAPFDALLFNLVFIASPSLWYLFLSTYTPLPSIRFKEAEEEVEKKSWEELFVLCHRVPQKKTTYIIMTPCIEDSIIETWWPRRSGWYLLMINIQ